MGRGSCLLSCFCFAFPPWCFALSCDAHPVLLDRRIEREHTKMMDERMGLVGRLACSWTEGLGWLGGERVNEHLGVVQKGGFPSFAGNCEELASFLS
ncbi:hypothetical protein BKA80DRAFT_280359 [Phyllosticta citrichinensis]